MGRKLKSQTYTHRQYAYGAGRALQVATKLMHDLDMKPEQAVRFLDEFCAVVQYRLPGQTESLAPNKPFLDSCANEALRRLHNKG